MRRLFWTGLGWSLGLGTSVWVQRRARRAVARLAPPAVRDELAARGAEVVDRSRSAAVSAREGLADLRRALEEGRRVRRRTEEALRAEFGLPPRARAAAGTLRPVDASR